MLLPFEKNVLFTSRFNGKYLPTLINDLFKFEKIPGGIIACVLEDRTGFVLFRENKIISINSFHNGPGNEWARCSSLFSILESGSLDVFVNVIDDSDVIDNISVFLNSSTAMMIPYEFADIKRIISMIEAEKESGVIGFKNGAVVNMAVYKEGTLEKFYYYHPATRAYAFDSNPLVFESYLSLFHELKPFVVYKRGSGGKVFSPDACELEFLHNDSVASLILSYTDIFELIYKELKEKLEESKVVNISTHLFNALREKYSPLYNSVNYSKATGSVNWNSFFDERKYISVEYRFEKYHLYLDELLRLMLKISQSAIGSSINETMIPSIRKYLEHLYEKEPDKKEMVDRVDKMIEKVK